MRDCTCIRCVNACKTNPGWPTVAEAKTIIAAGHSAKLMLNWWDLRGGKKIYVLSPASEGCEGDMAPSMWRVMLKMCQGPCVFLKDDRCSIHEIKPFACRNTLCCEDDGVAMEPIARQWATPEGRALVKAWKQEHGVR